MIENLGLWIAGLTFAAAMIAYSAKITWKVRDIEREIREDMDAQIENLQRDVGKLSSKQTEREDHLRREFGETASALRTKIHEMETWNRDTFVRKESFEGVIGRLESSIEKLGDKLEARIDKAVERLHSRPD